MYPVIDLHEDVAYHLMFKSGAMDFDVDVEGRQSDIPKLKRGNVKVVFASVFPIMTTYSPEQGKSTIHAYSSYSAKDIALEMIKTYYRLTDRFSNSLMLINSIKDVENALSNGKIGLLISMEGADALEDPYDLLLFHRLGVRSLGITWNLDNKYGASCFTKRDYGLTGNGEELVKLANRLGVIVDLAHASRRTMIDVLSVSRKPVIISHANSRAVYDHPRNVDDEVLSLLNSNGGVIGVTMIPETIGKEPTIDSLIKHIIHIRDSFGLRILALGTDYLGIGSTPIGLEDVSRIGRLIEGLMKAGLSDDEIRGLMFENALRVIKANLTI